MVQLRLFCTEISKCTFSLFYLIRDSHLNSISYRVSISADLVTPPMFVLTVSGRWRDSGCQRV